MANWSGVAATLGALVRPAVLQPTLTVPSLAHLDFARLAAAHPSLVGVVVDKDNCIAAPQADDLAPDPALRAAWAQLLAAFGPANVLVVSNSAGLLPKDPLQLQAAALSRNLGVPVLLHPHPKPAQACVHQIAAHFLSARPTLALDLDHALSPTAAGPGQVVFSPLARLRLPPPSSSPPRPPPPPGQPLRLLVIGDRLATDMILAHRLSALRLPLPTPALPRPRLSRLRLRRLLELLLRPLAASSPAPPPTYGRPSDRIEAIPILTTRLWAREGLGTTLLRYCERAVLAGLRRRRAPSPEPSSIQWEEFVQWKDSSSGVVGSGVASHESPSAAPVPAGRGKPPQPTSRLHLTPSVSSTLANLSTLPTRLHTSLTQTLPHKLSHWVRSLPARVLSTAERTILWGVARGADPTGWWARGVKAYTTQPLPPPSSGNLVPASSTNAAGLGSGAGAGARVERWMDRIEEVWREAQRRARAP